MKEMVTSKYIELEKFRMNTEEMFSIVTIHGEM